MIIGNYGKKGFFGSSVNNQLNVTSATMNLNLSAVSLHLSNGTTVNLSNVTVAFTSTPNLIGYTNNNIGVTFK